MSNSDRTASNVRAELARQGWTQAELAHHLGKTQPAISRRLCGQVDFTVTELYDVAALLGIDVRVLLDPPVAA